MITLSANGPGIGDAIFLTAVAREIKKQKPMEEVITISRYPEVFIDNPDIYAAGANWTTAGFPELHNQKEIKEHNVAFMCRKLGLIPPKWENIRQYLYVPHFIESRDYITLHARAGEWTRNKNWYDANWMLLITRIKEELNTDVVLLGSGIDRCFPQVSSSLMGENLRFVASAIQGARLHVGLVSGLMHMASGVGTKSVIIYGGREDPKITGYANNINIVNSNCSLYPCWLIEDSPFNRRCMQEITVDQVFQEVKNALQT
jgi:ADP-heptose:LPS heptosyltransferase